MNINWKLRFKNKTTLTAIVLAVLALVYKVIELLGLVPPVAQEELITVAEMAIGLLVLLGVVVDPTTEGMQDSDRAMGYDEPAKK